MLGMSTVLCCAVAFSTYSAPQDVDSIESRVLENRRAIESGHLILDIEDDSLPSELRITHYFDGDKHRKDSRRPIADTPGEGNPQYSTDIHSYADGAELTFCDMIPTGEGPSGASIRSQKDSTMLPLISHPRMLGMAPCSIGLLHVFHLESFVASTGRKDVSIIPDVRNDIECQLIEYTSYKGFRNRVWIAPSKGHSILRIQSEYESSGGNLYLESVDVDVDEFDTPKGKVWFPTSLHTLQLRNGEIIHEQRVEIEVVSLNEPLDLETFTFVGMGVPVGNSATDLRPEARSKPMFGGGVWDGEKIVARDPTPLSQEVTPYSPNTDRPLLSRIPWAFISIGLAVLGAVCLGFYYRQRQQ